MKLVQPTGVNVHIMPKKIVLVRHGRTEYNLKNIVQGQLHIPLDEYGLKQATVVADKLKNEAFDIIYSSDLARTMQTAEVIAMAMKKKVTPSILLRERSLGVLEGKNKGEVLKLLQVDKKLSSYHFWNFVEKRRHAQFQMEKLRDLQIRVDSFIKEIKKHFAGKNVLAISHSGTIRIILHKLGFDEGFLKKITIRNTAIVRLFKKDGRYDLEIDDNHIER